MLSGLWRAPPGLRFRRRRASWLDRSLCFVAQPVASSVARLVASSVALPAGYQRATCSTPGAADTRRDPADSRQSSPAPAPDRGTGRSPAACASHTASPRVSEGRPFFASGTMRTGNDPASVHAVGPPFRLSGILLALGLVALRRSKICPTTARCLRRPTALHRRFLTPACEWAFCRPPERRDRDRIEQRVPLAA